MSDTLILSEKYTHFRDLVLPSIKNQLKTIHFTGCSLALLDGEEVVWAEGLGFANREESQPVELDSIFKAGSVTKIITALGILRLVDAGRISLDQPVADILPRVIFQYRTLPPRKITVRDLMTHHAGLPCDFRKNFYAKSFEDDPDPIENIIPFINTHPMPYPPGYILSYSNLGADLLGLIIQQVSGQRFADYIKTEVLQPLGMNSSSIDADESIKEKLVKGYSGDAGEWEPQLRDLPAGGLFTTATDLTKVAAVVMNHGRANGVQFLNPQIVREMLTPQNADNPRDFGLNIGLNWFLSYPNLRQAQKVCWHDGGTINFSTILICLPEQNLAVAVMLNSFAALPVHALGTRILREALEERNIKPYKPDKPNKSTLDLPKLNQAVGSYPTISFGPVNLSVTGNQASVSIRGSELNLAPREDPGWYGLEMRLLGLIKIPMKQLDSLRIGFQEIEGEQFIAFENAGVRQAVGVRLEPQTVPQSWLDRLGMYKNLDSNDLDFPSYNLVYKNGYLMLETTVRKMGALQIVLLPVDDNHVITAGMGRFAREEISVQMDEDENEILELWGLLFNKEL
jgi:CubicO group peptidase (beta-lactamase class C family)